MFSQGLLTLFSTLLFMNVGGLCPIHPEPSVNVTLNIQEAILNLKLNNEGIAKLGEGLIGTQNPYDDFEKDHYIGSGISITIGNTGLTIPRMTLKTEIRLEHVQQENASKPCYAIGLSAIMEASTDVYVSNSYERGSCEYLATLRHEHKHVLVQYDLLEKYKPIIEGELGDVIKGFIIMQGNRAIPQELGQVSQNNLSILIQKKIQLLLEIMSADMLAQQQKLDTHEEYRKVKKECTYLNKYLYMNNSVP